MNNNIEYSKRFAEAIRTLARKPENIDNLESYLYYHFDKWLEIYAKNPAGITEELEHFASIETF